MRRGFALAPALGLLGVTVSLSAQLPARFQQRVDSAVAEEMAKERVPGVSLAVIRAGHIVYERGYGYSNVEHQVAASPATIYQSGSVGKQFTAALVMLLVQDGTLSLTDSVTRFFPDAPAAWNRVTIRHLLTHTSGAVDYPETFNYRHDYTEDDMRRLVLSLPLDFPPGARWQYSNLGYVLLGAIIHRATGVFYADLLRTRIFLPFGLTTARLISEADIVPNRAAGYRLTNGELRNQEWVSPVVNTTADGSLYLTVRDLARWDAALYGHDLLTPESFRQVTTPVTLNDGTTYPYGFGWGVGSVRDHRYMAHSGSWQGFKSYIVRYPDDSLTVVALANLEQAEPTRIAQMVVSLWNPALARSEEE